MYTVVLSCKWLARNRTNWEDVWDTHQVNLDAVLLPFYPHKLQNDLPFDLPHLAVHLSHHLEDPQNVHYETWRAYQCTWLDLVKESRILCCINSHLLFSFICLVCLYLSMRIFVHTRESIIGVENIDLFPPITIYVTCCDSNCIPLSVSECIVRRTAVVYSNVH